MSIFSGTTGLGNLTISKNDVPFGTASVIYIDNVKTANQGYTQDANNYYVWYATQFSTHQVSIIFSGSLSSSLPVEIAVAMVIVAIVVGGLLVYWRKRRQ